MSVAFGCTIAALRLDSTTSFCPLEARGVSDERVRLAGNGVVPGKTFQTRPTALTNGLAKDTKSPMTLYTTALGSDSLKATPLSVTDSPIIPKPKTPRKSVPVLCS